jgi:hypothetical protein
VVERQRIVPPFDERSPTVVIDTEPHEFCSADMAGQGSEHG